MESNKISREIDVIAIVKKVWKEKKTLYAFLGVFAVLGVIKALCTPKEYTTNVLLAPELGTGGGISENISSLASMVGVDFSSSNKSIDAIYPEIYPDVLASSDFIINLFDIKVRMKEDPAERTYFRHLVFDTPIPFWSYPSIWLAKLMEKKDKRKSKGIDPFYLTKAQDEIVKKIRSNISCTVDKKTSVISISVKDNDPFASAIIADTIKSRLQQYIISYRTQKARNDLEQNEKLCEEAHKQYLKAKDKYAVFSDANENIVLQSYKLKAIDLENEMQLKFNNYSGLVQQVQLAKAKVQERTPAFTVIQSSTVPLKASSTPRSVMVILFIFLGGVLDVIWVMFRPERKK